MKKTIMVLLVITMLFAATSIASAKDPIGRISFFYYPATLSGSLSVNGKEIDKKTAHFEDNTANSFGFLGGIGLTQKLSATVFYVTGKGKSNDGKILSDSKISLAFADGSYKLYEDKKFGRIDATLGYIRVNFEEKRSKPGTTFDEKLSGLMVGVRGRYDLPNKLAIEYKMSYAPSLDAEGFPSTVSFDSGHGFLYRLGVDYPLNEQFSVNAGFQGVNGTYKYKSNALPITYETDLGINGFYLGTAMKF